MFTIFEYLVLTFVHGHNLSHTPLPIIVNWLTIIWLFDYTTLVECLVSSDQTLVSGECSVFSNCLSKVPGLGVFYKCLLACLIKKLYSRFYAKFVSDIQDMSVILPGFYERVRIETRFSIVCLNWVFVLGFILSVELRALNDNCWILSVKFQILSVIVNCLVLSV